MQSNSRWLGAYAVVFLALILPLGITAWSWALDSLPSRELRVFRLVQNKVLEDYVEAKDPDELVVDAIKGMVKSLDPYCQFVPAEEVHHFVGSELEGTYQGIGVLLLRDVSPLTVQCPLPGGPAENAGIQVGDQILAVEGEDLASVPAAELLEYAQKRIRGMAGTRVQLLVKRQGVEPFTVDLLRADVPEPKVRWAHLIDAERKFGYVWIEGFQRHVDAQLGEELAWLSAEAGGRLEGLILDLRHDPGGLLEEAVAMANRFVPSGDIVKLVRRDAVVVERHTAKPERCTAPDLPIVVLVDQATASASEVVTGALQDHGRATVVGLRTYGKGVVQSIYQWQNLDVRLKLTTSYYYTPSGRCIDRTRHPEGQGGIAPDVEAKLDDDRYHEVLGRLQGLEIPRRYRAAAEALAAKLGIEVAGPPSPAEDTQLAAALEALIARSEQPR